MKLCFLFLVVWFLTVFCATVESFDCQTFNSNNGNDGYIMSPKFPEAFPDGPYNCTYNITNPTGGGVLVEFTDFQSHEQYNGTTYKCRERILISTDGSTDDENLEQHCSLTYAFFASTRDVITIIYEVTGVNLFGIPGFKAKYSLLSAEDVTNAMQMSSGYLSHYIMPYYSEDLLYYTKYPGFTTTITRVVEGVTGQRIAYSFDNFPDDLGSFTIEIRDGSTSESPLLAKWTDAGQINTIYSQSNVLYVRFSASIFTSSMSLPGAFVSFSSPLEDGLCEDGFYKCSGTDRCIGVSAVCDGHNHCGDDSDETPSKFNCTEKEWCEGPFSCRYDGECQFEYDSYFCKCQYGYRGERCEYRIQGCPMDCLNGGTCNSYVCTCDVGYYGDSCEQSIYECDPPCQHGGVCNAELQCVCDDNCISDTCDCSSTTDQIEPSESMAFFSSRLFYIGMPIVVAITILALGIVLLQRRRSQRRRHQNEATKTTQAVAYTAVPVQNATVVCTNSEPGVQNSSDTAPQATIEEAIA